MHKIFNLLFLTLVAILPLTAQEYTWKLVHQYVAKNIEAWDVNPIGQPIFTKDGSIIKLDTNFQVLFIQSNADFGTISKIDATHSLKTMIFSRNQQSIAVLDNTLSFQEGRLDLSNIDIGFATDVCYTNQSHRFWVYDEINARLIKIEGINPTLIQSEISNLRGLLRESISPKLQNIDQQLFLFYQGSGLYLFDYYGSLLRKFEDPLAQSIGATKEAIFFLQDNQLKKVTRIDGNISYLSLPIKNIEDFKIRGQFIYFKTTEGIQLYHLIHQK